VIHRAARAAICLQEGCTQQCTNRLLGTAWNRLSEDWQLAS
jgi:hypothetical protein